MVSLNMRMGCVATLVQAHLAWPELQTCGGSFVRSRRQLSRRGVARRDLGARLRAMASMATRFAARDARVEPTLAYVSEGRRLYIGNVDHALSPEWLRRTGATFFLHCVQRGTATTLTHRLIPLPSCSTSLIQHVGE